MTIAAALAVWLPCLVLWYGLALGGGLLFDWLLILIEWFLGVLKTASPA
ncbi:hypothetical protein [Amaricoccus sp.]|nr:hypothetical protein [Amaricoccus sp.]MBP7241347.1 hypothetical protein [Amaricoccus sp.]